MTEQTKELALSGLNILINHAQLNVDFFKQTLVDKSYGVCADEANAAIEKNKDKLTKLAQAKSEIESL